MGALTTVPHLLSNFNFKDCLNLDEYGYNSMHALIGC